MCKCKSKCEMGRFEAPHFFDFTLLMARLFRQRSVGPEGFVGEGLDGVEAAGQ